MIEEMWGGKVDEKMMEKMKSRKPEEGMQEKNCKEDKKAKEKIKQMKR